VLRGLKDAVASWKTGCIAVRSMRNRGAGNSERQTPFSVTLPMSGLVKHKHILPSVDLPDPDSPTSAKVSRCLTYSDTPFTATTVCPFARRYFLLTEFTSS